MVRARKYSPEASRSLQGVIVDVGTLGSAEALRDSLYGLWRD